MGKSFVAIALGKIRTNSINISPFGSPGGSEDRNLQGDVVANDFAKIDGGCILCDQSNIKCEQVAYLFGTIEPSREKIVLTQRRRNLQQAICLRKIRHSLRKSQISVCEVASVSVRP